MLFHRTHGRYEPLEPNRPTPPMVWRLYPTFSTVRTCRMADGRDRNSELIEVVW